MGDYSISKISLDIKRQTPKSTIDRQPRFPKETSLNTFVPNVPLQHIKEAQKVLKRPAEFGTMYKAKRFDSPR